MCYGKSGYEAAQELFQNAALIRPYEGEDLMRLYLRRAKYMTGSDFDTLIKQEQRKLQGLAPCSGAHINCDPIRADGDRTLPTYPLKRSGR